MRTLEEPRKPALAPRRSFVSRMTPKRLNFDAEPGSDDSRWSSPEKFSDSNSEKDRDSNSEKDSYSSPEDRDSSPRRPHTSTPVGRYSDMKRKTTIKRKTPLLQVGLPPLRLKASRQGKPPPLRLKASRQVKPPPLRPLLQPTEVEFINVDLIEVDVGTEYLDVDADHLPHGQLLKLGEGLTPDSTPEKSREMLAGLSPLEDQQDCLHRPNNRRMLPPLLPLNFDDDDDDDDSLRVITSPSTAPGRNKKTKTVQFRRKSAPGGIASFLDQETLPGGRFRGRDGELVTKQKTVKKDRLANINPFTPAPLTISSNIQKEKETLLTNNICTPKVVNREAIPMTAFRNSNDRSYSTDSTPIQNKEPTNKIPTTASPFETKDVLIGMNSPLNPSNRLKIRDINISRYKSEFLELKEIGGGQYGQVKIVRHRLDGMIYAIKVTKYQMNGGHGERAIMNEVFAHAALMKHSNIVRYYNSWVEKGHVYIQNEYCEGGSLSDLIEKRKESQKPFTEQELRKIASNIARGLGYIHSKGLVHLDIKPENIFVALDHSARNSNVHNSEDSSLKKKNAITNPKEDKAPLENFEVTKISTPSSKEENDTKTKCLTEKPTVNFDWNSTDPNAMTPELIKPLFVEGSISVPNSKISDDSGNASWDSQTCSPDCKETKSYKIGDLGHAISVHRDYVPEEGDCRYFAPELLGYHVDREKVFKADIFSLGLTLYECATLEKLPKNSEESAIYESLRNGKVPHISRYTKNFNQLIKLMTSPDPVVRPDSHRVLSHPFIKKRRRSMKKVLHDLETTKRKLSKLKKEISASSENQDQILVENRLKRAKISHE